MVERTSHVFAFQFNFAESVDVYFASRENLQFFIVTKASPPWSVWSVVWLAGLDKRLLDDAVRGIIEALRVFRLPTIEFPE